LRSRGAFLGADEVFQGGLDAVEENGIGPGEKIGEVVQANLPTWLAKVHISAPRPSTRMGT